MAEEGLPRHDSSVCALTEACASMGELACELL
jgi:hypothetical protein